MKIVVSVTSCTCWMYIILILLVHAWLSMSLLSSVTTTTTTTTCTSTSRYRHYRPFSSQYGYPLYSIVTKNQDNNNDDDEDLRFINDPMTTTPDVASDTEEDQHDDDENQEENQQQQQEPKFVRYRCRVSYHGAGFNGFQIQPNSRTIQGELETILSRRFNQPVRVVGAGRTDAGVHARGQAIHFDLLQQQEPTTNDDNDDNNYYYNNETLLQIEYSINQMFQPKQDLRIWNLSCAPLPKLEWINNTTQKICSWNVMRKCYGKLYSYRFSTSSYMNPMERHTRWQLDLPILQRGQRTILNITYLQTLLHYYEGTHDFGCFATAVEQTFQKQQQNRKQQLLLSQMSRRSRHHQEKEEVMMVDHNKKNNNKNKNTEVGDLSSSSPPPPLEKMDTVRTVYSVTLVDEGQDNYRIDFQLEGALYKMVRNMVGTAIDACLGKEYMSEEHFLSLLQLSQPSSSSSSSSLDTTTTTTTAGKKKKKLTRDDNGSKPAPPQGLTMEWVYYHGDTNF